MRARPSGVSYCWKNRENPDAVFQELLRTKPSTQLWRDIRTNVVGVAIGGPPLSRRGGADPVALMKTAFYNSAYYSIHLADKLGIELVEGRELIVKNR